MGKLKLALCAAMAFVLVTGGMAFAGEKVLFGFEKDMGGWEIPDWAMEKEDYVGTKIELSTAVFKEGKSCLKLDTKFPGGKWTAAYVEIQQYFDWTAYSAVAVDVYLPETAPVGLKSKMILTVGESWAWVEMARSTALEPGKWTTITANIMPASTDFRATVDDAFRKDIRKVGVRIESNMKPVYEGPVYIDNFRLIEVTK
ncbi:MAG TPA: hypothetical protein VMD52_06620 [Patescibacteria group bacterium]|nr:hypothetical protein [Patescibacteria group bacterium]